MDISIFLSKALGLYLLILSVGMLINVRNIKSIVMDILKDPAVLFVTGILALIIGILMVVSHNIWTSDWRVVITIIGWLSLVKGTIRVVFPQTLISVQKKWMQSTMTYYVTFSLTLLLGVFLCYAGYINNQF